jgi:hypothetical protein
MAGIFDLLHNLFGVCLLAVIGKDDAISLRGDVQGDALAQTAGSAGYECDFHGCLLSKLGDSHAFSRCREWLLLNSQTSCIIA